MTAARSRWATIAGGGTLFGQQRDPVGMREAQSAIDALDAVRLSIAAIDQLAHFAAVQQRAYDRAIALHLSMDAMEPD